jgi:hypothetical protein
VPDGTSINLSWLAGEHAELSRDDGRAVAVIVDSMSVTTAADDFAGS